MAHHLELLVRQWRSSYPPLANIASCRTCRSGDITTAWTRRQSVEGPLTQEPRHPALSWMMTGPGRRQLTCKERGKLTDKYIHILSLISVIAVISLLIIIFIIRWGHSSWASPSGLMLLGGGGDGLRTTEKINENGTSSYSFPLKYDTRWSWAELYSILLTYFLQLCLRHKPGKLRDHYRRLRS